MAKRVIFCLIIAICAVVLFVALAQTGDLGEQFRTIIEQANVPILIRLFIIGVDFAAVFYSISLWLRKRSERYLLAFAGYTAFALLHVARRAFQFISDSAFIGLIFGFRFWDAMTPEGNSALANMWVVFWEFLMRYLVLRTFVPTKLGKLEYVWIGAAGFVVSYLVATFTTDATVATWTSTIFRIAFPCLECAVIMRGYLTQGAREQAVLVLAWCMMLSVLVYNWACELLIIDTFSIGPNIGLGGIAESILILGLLYAISARFAEKFAEAEVLSAELSKMNQGLEAAVVQKTAELQQSYDDLRKTQKQKDELTSNVAHNIKTPLFTIAGYSEMATQSLETNPGEVREYLDIIHRNADRAQSNVRNLLMATRLEDKVLRFTPMRMDLIDMLQKLVMNGQARAQVTHVTLELLQGEQGHVWVYADGVFLSQAFENIIDNALESCSEEGLVTVEVLEDAERDRVAVHVRDNGCGIAKEDLEHIFDRYWSHKGNQRNGTGLGLSIARDIIEQSNGTITVESTVGQGTVCTVEFPIDTEK